MAVTMTTTAELTDFARARTVALLEQWWRVAPSSDGLLQPAHGPAWERSADRRRSLVSQSRFVHNFVRGWELTRDERWREAARMAVRGLRCGFPSNACRLPVFYVEESGAVLDDRVWPYGIAFALFGLAQGATVDGDPEIPATAERWWQALARLRDAHGGWAWHYSPEGRPEPGERTHNPIMHLVEALLAWRRHDARWQARLEEVLAFADEHLLGPDRRYIPEFCDEHWRPLTGTKRSFISIGHQWEWAHLLVQAAVAGVPGIDLDLARTLAATGRRLGLRGPDDLVSRVWLDGSIKADRHLYWDYCEAARACVWLTAKDVAAEYYALLPGLMRGLENRCYDAASHGYVTCSDQPPEAMPKGDSWRVDYHQIGLFADLIRLAPELPVAVGEDFCRREQPTG